MGYAAYSYRSRPMAGRDYVREYNDKSHHYINNPVEYPQDI